jgi:hypothetical protein
MTSAAAILDGLPTLMGELPAASANDVTLMLCVTPDDIDGKLFARLAAVRDGGNTARVHLHVLGAGPETQARLILWSESHPDLALSSTWEDAIPETTGNGAASALGVVRLFHIAGLVRGKFVLTDQVKVGLLPAGLNAHLDQSPVITPGNTDLGLILAIDGNDYALSLLAAVAQPLAERIRSGVIGAADAVIALDAVVRQALTQSPDFIGTFTGGSPVLTATDIADPIVALWPETSGLKVLLLKPDMALPFKSPNLVADRERRKTDSPFMAGAHGALRESWGSCFTHLRDALTARGHAAVCIERPGAEITAELADAAGADVVILPHRQRFQCPGLKTPALFLMQIAHRWLFTLDENGWGAGATGYPYNGFHESPDDGAVFDAYRRALMSTNDSKFGQPDRRSRADLVAGGTIPDRPYLFFPCQIPDDEVVRFFCDVSEEDVIAALTNWATVRQIDIVFKAHPAAPQTSESFKAIASTPFTHWADASVHDLIESCEAVVTLNSGVGHEAILHEKPIVMFGRSEYDRLAIHATLDGLDEAYERVNAWDRSSQLKKYRQFYHWFTRDMAIDLRDAPARTSALAHAVDRIERLV